MKININLERLEKLADLKKKDVTEYKKRINELNSVINDLILLDNNKAR